MELCLWRKLRDSFNTYVFQ